MDKKVGQYYPTYLVNDDYGIRGLDYRAQSDKHGISMLIVSPFSDMRTRLQGLLRICRHGDIGEYIQNTLVPEIDPNLKIDHVARMTVAEKEIMKLLPKKK